MSNSHLTPQTGGGNFSAPVIIAGAGPVGLSLALALARAGVESIILEKKDRPAPYSRAILIPARTLDIFQGWGMLDAITREGIFSRRLLAYAAETGAVAISIDFSEIRELTANSGFLFLPQDRTEAHLLESLQSTGRSQVRFGASVSGFFQDRHGVTVDVLEGNSSKALTCQYLIGCDGGHSPVRQHLGFELVGKTYKTRVLIADVAFKGDVSLPTPRIALRARGPLVMLRFDKSRWRIVGSVMPDESEGHAISPAGVATRVRQLAGDRQFDLMWSSTFHIHSRVATRFRSDRVFLAGDAAHLSSPAGGMGMNSGIEDANNLAWKITAVLSGASPSLLDSYEAERRHAVVHDVEQTSDIASNTLYFAPYRVRQFFMALFAVIMKIRPIRRRILVAMNMLATRYPGSEFIGGDLHWAGRLAPDCEMGTAAVPTRLFTGRRGSFIVICHAVAQPAECPFEAVEISALDAPAFRRAWKVSGPFAAIVRPDGFIAWAKQRPTARDIQNAANAIAKWSGLNL